MRTFKKRGISMKNRKKAPIEMDDEFIAQLDFLRSDHDSALQMIDQQM